MNNLTKYILRIADDSFILGHRLSEWCGTGPILEEDIAMTNIALDLIGQATSLYEYAGKTEGKNRSADDLAFLRYQNEYTNALLVEQPNGDFAHTMVRQWLFDTFRVLFFNELIKSSDATLSAVAEKSLKETKYHVKHSSEWVIRMGDGTEESHQRAQTAVNTLWRYKDELFYSDEVDSDLLAAGISIDLETIRSAYNERINLVLLESTLSAPENNWKQTGGRKGVHTEHLGFALTELQYMQRAYPGMEW